MKKHGKRECLNNQLSRDLIRRLEKVFESTVEISGIQLGKKQSIETLISEEALVFAKFIRNEKQVFNPRIPKLSPVNYIGKKN